MMDMKGMKGHSIFESGWEGFNLMSDTHSLALQLGKELALGWVHLYLTCKRKRPPTPE